MSNEKRTRVGPSHAWLAWTLFALTSLFLVGALVFSVLIEQRPDQDLGFRAAFAGFSLVGLLIALRRPDNALGWLCSASGISITASFFLDQIVWSTLATGSAGLPAVQWVGLFSKQVLQDIGWAGLYLVPMLFPTGRFLSSRWRLAGLSSIALLLLITSMDALVAPTLSGYALPIANPLPAAFLGDAWSMARPLLLVPSTLLLFVALPAPPVLRYRRAQSAERQQLKWLAFAMLPWLGLFAASGIEALTGAQVPQPLWDVALPLCIAAVPTAIAIAILRYRLYDIDIIIRRTLIYSLLTAILAVVYFGGVVLLQALLRPLTGAGNDLAVVASTLLIAALFLPLRQRVQGFIDRRFYRRKYDAAKTLAAFSHTVRDEVELEKLTGRLVEVVDETMQPAHVSLWLANRPERPENPGGS